MHNDNIVNCHSVDFYHPANDIFHWKREKLLVIKKIQLKIKINEEEKAKVERTNRKFEELNKK